MDNNYRKLDIFVTTYVNSEGKINIHDYLLDNISNLNRRSEFKLNLIIGGYLDQKVDSRISSLFDNIYTSDINNLSASRNKGILKARSKYIFFLDDDDLLETDFYTLVEKSLTGDHSKIYLNFTVVEKKIEFNVIDKLNYNGTTLRTSGYRSKMFIFEVDYLIKNNLYYDETIIFCEDVEFSHRNYKIDNSIGVVLNPCYRYLISRDDHMSFSNDYIPKVIDAFSFFSKNEYNIKKVYGDLIHI